jgi:hypothetical protein
MEKIKMLSFEEEFATAFRAARASFPDGGRTRSPGILAQAMTSSNPDRDVDDAPEAASAARNRRRKTASAASAWRTSA